MEIQRLSKDIVEKTRSGFAINSIAQCVFELVSNSIDADCTAVAVRLNLATLRIQVVDNGSGISKENLKIVGIRYMTNKCNSLKQLDKHIVFHGFRGEALASIIDLCKSVNFTSKVKNSNKTYSKTVENGKNGKTELVKDRPSPGTTITIEGFLSKLPVRQKRIVKEIEFEDVRKCLECLIIIQPKISFSLRDDTTGTLVLNSQKNVDIIGSFRSLHPEIDEQFVLLKVSKHKITVEGLIHKESFENKKLQYVYVNKRPVLSPKIQRIISDIYQKSNISHDRKTIIKNKHPIFVVNIKCPHCYVDILFNPSKTMVEFKHFDLIEHCLIKMMNSYFGKENVPNKISINKEHDFKGDQGVSQVKGAVQACGFKRPNNILGKHIPLPEKCPKLDATNSPQNNSNLNVENINTRQSEIEMDDNMFNFLLSKPSYKQIVSENHNDKICLTKVCEEQKVTKIKPCLKTRFVRNRTKKQTQSTLFSGNYDIEDSSEPQENLKNPKFAAEKFKRPLPITIVPRPEKLPKYQSQNLVNCREHVVEENAVLLEKSCFDAKSELSKFTDDENKGKNLIMDMFLKSTQVFNSDSDTTGEETIQESNFCIEQTVQDNLGRFNTTMSISVNMKRRKIKRKSQHTQGDFNNRGPNNHDKTSKCVQTTFLDNNNMTSKCVQTSINQNNHHQIENTLPVDAIAENYTIVMGSTVSKNQRLKFVKKLSDDNVNEMFDPQNQVELKCNCNRSRFFNFKRLKSADERSICEKVNRKLTLSSSKSIPSLENINISPIKGHVVAAKSRRQQNIVREVDNIDAYLNHHQIPLAEHFAPTFQGYPQPANYQYFVPQSFQPYGIPIREYPWVPNSMFPDHYVQNPFIVGCNNGYEETRSNAGPHFLKPDTVSQSYSFFNPEFKSTQINMKNNFNNKCFINAQNNPIRSPFWERQNYTSTEQFFNENIAFHPLQINDQNKIVDPSLSHYFDDGIDHSKALYNTDHNFCKNYKDKNDSLFSLGKPRTIDPYMSLSRLVISLSEKEKKELLEKELQEANERNKIKLFNQQSQLNPTSGLSEKEKSRIVMDSQNEWVKQVNGFGNTYYINQRTGMTTFVAPKNDENLFHFEKRLNFIPIGSSPIMRGHKPVDKFLSQRAKTKLHNFIMESYENELMVIKWENYIEDDPRNFFEDLYLEKQKLFENCIPTVAKHNNVYTGSNNILSFNKTLFKNLEIIGQVDKKFIAVLDKNKKMLILFDQHAVHERIRLEHLLNVYKGKKEVCKEKIMFFITQNDLSLLKQNEDCINSVGLEVEFFVHGLCVTKIPTCLQQKFSSNQDTSSLNEAIDSLLKEVIDWLKSTRGAAHKCVPKVIQNAINMEACRGAIKFGDALNKTDCEMLLKELVVCSLPFQCAHGRPTLTPLLTLQNNNTKVKLTVNLRRLNVRRN